jgi:biotin transport system substrate-specific component
MPVFADGEAGMEVIRGATGGYLVGFVLAAAVVGWMAEHRQDRTFATMFTAFIVGSVVVYVAGVIGLMLATGWPLEEAVAGGVVPFLLGDLIKAAAAGVLLPGAWRLAGER